MELYNKFLKEKRTGISQEGSENLENFKKNGIGKNFINLVSMANYLISKGHNNETFNPFRYPLQKLIKTFKIAKKNEYESLNETLFSQIVAISSAFGDKESVLYFQNKIKNLEENL